MKFYSSYTTRVHKDDVEKPERDTRLAEILTIHDGRVLYHRLDIPTHKDAVGRDTHPRRFSLPVAVFNERYV